jgi:hypothetical protein
LLRIALLLLGGIMLAAAGLCALAGCRLAATIPLAVWGTIFAGGVLIERWRYRPLAEGQPGRRWQVTQERFVDPETGRLVTVFLKPETGERRYVAGEERRPGGCR